MPVVVFVTADGQRIECDGEIGDSVMQVAVANGVEGIVGECGGSMMCATCHCFIDDQWIGLAGSRNDGESDMLECAASQQRTTSRLSCQVRLNSDLNGLIVHLPEAQV
ncbi:2Fe-2S iron-sulfur cluster-binding protein [Agrobacterium leguminum]|uniref:2Fe-2S iron-sulfur cluster-binding protein n=1 Tax=Agrobacterium leguminum TaxID=2792015 RepID=A0A9X3KGW0_9HYPH|nr:2Fe-2S iron-sulfur cluster-binding protein [Agrobacterium leguminum]MCZ7911481.1 2Fe-2S iron-sulfur cluster-binding protein [Agrobacterium leguminum]